MTGDVGASLTLIGFTLSGGYETLQALVDVGAPCVGAVVETLIRRNESPVGKTDFGALIGRGDVEGDGGVVPPGFVLDETQEAVLHVPDNPLPRDELGDLLLGVVHVFVAVRPFVAEMVGLALDVARPPSANIVDGVEGLPGRLLDRKRESQTLLGHRLLLTLVVNGENLAHYSTRCSWCHCRPPSKVRRGGAQ